MQNQQNLNKQDEWSDEEIINRAKKLAKGETNLASVLHIPEEDILQSANLALIFAKNASENAGVLIDGLLALMPENEYLQLCAAEIYQLLEQKEKAKTYLHQIKSNKPEIKLKKMEISFKLKENDVFKQELHSLKQMVLPENINKQILKWEKIELPN